MVQVTERKSLKRLCPPVVVCKERLVAVPEVQTPDFHIPVGRPGCYQCSVLRGKRKHIASLDYPTLKSREGQATRTLNPFSPKHENECQESNPISLPRAPTLPLSTNLLKSLSSKSFNVSARLQGRVVP